MARIIICCTLLLFNLVALAQQDSLVYQYWKRDPNTDVNTTTSNQKQVITKEQILLSGYTLLSDVLQLIDAWTISTWNGDRWNMVSNGVGNYQQQNWTLLLDGVKMELIKLDAPNINTLGISVNDIERIEVINTAGNYLGEFNDRGIIHIITKRNTPGFTYRAYGSNGNETGDPHLNAINQLNSNVHEYGTVLGNYLGFKTKKWNIQVSQYANNYFYRDTRARIYPLVSRYNAKPDMFNTMYGGRMLATYTSTKSTHQLTFNANQADDVILPAGIFNPITGKNNYYSVGYALRYQLSKGILQYRGSYTHRSFDGDLHQTLTHSQYHQNHNISYLRNRNLRTGNYIKQIGLEVNHLITSLNATSHPDYLIRPYYSITYPLTAKSTFFTDLSLATNFQDVIPKLALGYYKQPTILTNWSFIASFSQRNQFENNTYTYLLSLKDTNGLDLSDNLSSLATVDYFFNLNASKYFKISYNSGLKHLSNDVLFKPLPSATTPPFLLNTIPQLSNQTRWINRLNLHYDMFRGTQADVNYFLINTIGNKSELNRAIPKHKFTLVITQTLPSRFYLWIRYYYQSKTIFADPPLFDQPVLAGTANTFSTLKSLHTVDAGITKRLLKEYLIINMSVRNLFNTVETYQPSGAAFNLRLFLSVRANISSFTK